MGWMVSVGINQLMKSASENTADNDFLRQYIAPIDILDFKKSQQTSIFVNVKSNYTSSICWNFHANNAHMTFW